MDPARDFEDQTRALLEPGDIELVGLIVRTDLPRAADLEMIDATLAVGDRIAADLTDAPTYVYSGNDDPGFASNQHQCLTVEDDAFVWECQQLCVDGEYVLVFYFEGTDVEAELVGAIEAEGYAVTPVTTHGT